MRYEHFGLLENLYEWPNGEVEWHSMDEILPRKYADNICQWDSCLAGIFEEVFFWINFKVCFGEFRWFFFLWFEENETKSISNDGWFFSGQTRGELQDGRTTCHPSAPRKCFHRNWSSLNIHILSFPPTVPIPSAHQMKMKRIKSLPNNDIALN